MTESGAPDENAENASQEHEDNAALEQRFREEFKSQREADAGPHATRSVTRDVLALVPLLPCLAVHLYAVTGAARGRTEFLRRIDVAYAPWAIGIVFASLVAVAVFAVRERERERLFWLSLLLTLGLVALHGWVLQQAADERALYVVLRSRLATPLILGGYLIGLAGLAIHVMESVASLGERARLAQRNAAGIVGMVTAAALFVIAINAIAPFARGQAFFFRGGDAEQVNENIITLDSEAPPEGIAPNPVTQNPGGTP